MRIPVVYLLAFVLCFWFLGLSGCGREVPVITSASPVSTMVSKPASTAKPTVLPTLSTSTKYPSPTPIAENDQALQDKLAHAPELDGAVKEIRLVNGLRRVVYAAAAVNPYGVPAGDYLGEFKAEVLLAGVKSGGVALVREALLPLLGRAIEALPNVSEKWLLPLPVDLSDCKSLRTITIDRSAEPFIDKPYYIRVQFEEEVLDVVNILPGDQGLDIGDFIIFDLQYIVSTLSMENRAILPGQEMAFLFVVANLEDPIKPKVGERVPFGARVGRAGSPVLSGLSSVRGPFREHTLDCLLYLGGCPVFAISR